MANSADFPNSEIGWSDFNSTDNPEADGNQTGEYFGLDSLNGKAWVAWTDSREFYPTNAPESEKSNIGFAVVSFAETESGEIFSDGFESGDFSAWGQ